MHVLGGAYLWHSWKVFPGHKSGDEYSKAHFEALSYAPAPTDFTQDIQSQLTRVLIASRYSAV